MEDEYELVSSEEVERLKNEVEHLKSNPFVRNASDARLYDAVRNLNDSVTKLCILFENINKQLMKEYQSEDSPEAKLDQILEQNRNIAEALVTFVSKNETIEPAGVQQSTQNPIPGELPYPAIQQPLQMQGQVPPNPFATSQMPLRPISPQIQSQQPAMVQQQTQQSQQPQIVQQSIFPQTPQSGALNQPPISGNASQGQFQPFPQQKFNGRLNPNFPTPDDFQPMQGQPSIGEPINVDVKKKGFLGFGKK